MHQIGRIKDPLDITAHVTELTFGHNLQTHHTLSMLLICFDLITAGHIIFSAEYYRLIWENSLTLYLH